MQELEALAQNFHPPAFPGSYFVSFEGIEAAGKSTQILRVKAYLEERQFRVIVLREPGGTPFGEKLRQAILSSSCALHPTAEMCLFASSRAQLLFQVTLKELEHPGTVVLYDRFIDSSLAYQGKARGLGAASILALHQSFPLNLVPHLTLYLKIGPNLSLQRQRKRQSRPDYFEGQNLDFYQRLVEGYDEALQIFPERIVCIDGEQSENEVFTDVRENIDQLIYQRSGDAGALGN